MQAENSGTSSKSARAQFLLAGEEARTPIESLAQRSEHSSKRRRVEVSPENDRYAGDFLRLQIHRSWFGSMLWAVVKN